MEHAVDGAQLVANLETRAAPDAHPVRLALVVAEDREAPRIERLVPDAAPYPHVNVGENVHNHPFAQAVVRPVGRRAAHLLVGHRQHRHAHRRLDIEAVVEVMAALALIAAAHLADDAHHFVHAVLRGERPREMAAASGRRRRRSCARWGRARGPQAHLAQHAGGRVGHMQRAMPVKRHARRAAETYCPGVADLDIDADAGQPAQFARRRQLQDASARHVANIQKSIGGERQRQRPAQQWVVGLGICCGQRDHLPVCAQLADRAVVSVGDEQVASLVQRQAGRRIEQRERRRAIGKARTGAAGQRAHDAVRRDFTDPVIVCIGHVHIARLVGRYAHRTVEQGLSCRPVLEARRAGAGQRGDNAFHRHLADHVVAGVGHQQVARRVEGNARRRVESRRRAGAVDEAFAVAGQHRLGAIRRYFADLVMVAGIGQVHVAGPVQRHAERIGKAGAGVGNGHRPAHRRCRRFADQGRDASRRRTGRRQQQPCADSGGKGQGGAGAYFSGTVQTIHLPGKIATNRSLPDPLLH